MKKILKSFLNRLGFEINRLSPSTSTSTRLQCLFSHHKVDLVLDVGANVGAYVSFLRDLGYAGKVVSFEPLSTCYSLLESLSQKDPLWKIAPRAAIGSEDGEIVINISANSYSSSALDMLDSHLSSAPNSGYVGSETVPLKRLDDFAKQYMADDCKSVYLKIDVQGFELQVLEGAKDILPRINGIQLEMSLIPLYEGQILFREMLDKMDQFGYELYAIIPGFTDKVTGRLLQFDGVFFRK